MVPVVAQPCNEGTLCTHHWQTLLALQYPTRSIVLPDFLAFLLTMAARIVWLFLFRDPAAFLHFKRPSKAYRWTVFGTVLLTTFPNVIVHLWSLEAAWERDTIVLAGIVSALLAIVMWVPIVGLAWWMARRFLLASAESQEEFEPTFKTAANVASVHERLLSPAPEPYVDEPVASSEKYLSQAYKDQIVRGSDIQIAQTAVEQVGTPQQPEDLEPFDELPGTTSTAESLHCQTTARFEYLSQSHSGPHSWITFPVVPLILTTYATILIILLPVWIYEDRHYEYRPPSP